MKRTISVLLCLLLCLSACTPAPSTQTGSTNDTTLSTTQTTQPTTTETEPIVPPALYTAPLTAISVPIHHEESLSDDGSLLFTYSYQDFSLILEDPHVAETVTLDFLNRVDYSNSIAPSIHDAAQTAYTGQSDWTPYFYSIIYEPVRLDQGVLSLYGSEKLYDGSPRSTSVDLSVTYDLLTGNAIEEITEILTPEYSAETLCQLIIDALSDYAENGILFADYEYIISDLFATNTPVKSWYLSDSGLCFYFSPYEIAPYSAGTVMAEVPYESLNGIIKDRFFPAEQADLYGTVSAELLADTADFTQIAELVIDSDAEQYLIYTDGTLFDVRVEMCSADDNAESMQTTTIFAAASVSVGDALVIQCTPETLSSLQLGYQSGGTRTSAELVTLIPVS